MTIYLGADHRGFILKEKIKQILKGGGQASVVDLGNVTFDEHDDFPDYAKAVAEKVAEHPEEDRGIVICGSGFGVDIAANKIKGIRAALAMSAKHVEVGRHDDDVNVLALAADFIKEGDALAMVEKFLTTSFDAQEKRTRRLKKISELEQ